MVRAESVDVGRSLFHASDKFHGEDQIQVFSAKIPLLHHIIPADRCSGSGCRRIRFLQDGCRLCGSTEPDTAVCERCRSFREERPGNRTVYQQGLCRVTGCRILGLRVDQYRDGHLLVCIFIHIGMADTVRMSHNRNLCMIHDIADKCIGAAGDQKIHTVITLQQFIDLTVCGSLQQATFRNSCTAGGITDQFKEDFVGGSSFLPALQHGAVAALDAQTADLHEGIRSCLEYDPDHPDGNSDPLQNQTFVEFPFQGDPSGWIFKSKQAVDACQAVTQFVLVKAEPFPDRISYAVCVGARKIFPVCGEDLLLPGCERCCDRFQSRIADTDVQRSDNRRNFFHLSDIVPNTHFNNPPNTVNFTTYMLIFTGLSAIIHA